MQFYLLTKGSLFFIFMASLGSFVKTARSFLQTGAYAYEQASKHREAPGFLKAV